MIFEKVKIYIQTLLCLNKEKEVKMAAKSRRPAMNEAAMRSTRRSNGPLGDIWGFIIWLVGVLVSLAVGFGMTDATLGIPFLPDQIVVVAGWIVVILTILGVVLKIIDKASV